MNVGTLWCYTTARNSSLLVGNENGRDHGGYEATGGDLLRDLEVLPADMEEMARAKYD